MNAGRAPTPAVRALCLDFDGTLAHSTGDFGAFADGLRGELGLLHCDRNRFSPRLSEALASEGAVTLEGALAATLRALEQALPDDLGAVAARAVTAYTAQVALLPGALALLTFLRARGLPLALVSNGPADMQRAALRAVGVGGFFSCVLISGDAAVGVRKPHPRIFERACGALETPPENILMVGDDPHTDLRGARAAGLQAVGVGVRGEPEGVADLWALKGWLAARL
jgi:putative hydrolase of the HAD superfamily